MKRLQTTTIIVRGDGNKFLGVSRKGDHSDIGFGGGKCEEGETPWMCAVRELQEETGLILNEMELVDVRDYDFTDHKGTHHDEVWCFEVLDYEGAIDSNQNLVERGEGIVKWVTADELKKGTFGDYNEAILSKLYQL
jgi:8-oxo-dGTP diphosphatase